MLWNNETTIEFIRLYRIYVEQHSEQEVWGNKSGKWPVLAQQMTEKYGHTWEASQLRNKMAVLKTDFKIYELVVNYQGKGIDIRQDEALWKEALEINPKIARFQKEDFVFYDAMKDLPDNVPKPAGAPPAKKRKSSAKPQAINAEKDTDSDVTRSIIGTVTNSNNNVSDSDGSSSTNLDSVDLSAKRQKLTQDVFEAVRLLSQTMAAHRDHSRNQIKRCLEFLSTLKLDAENYAKAVRVVKECVELFDEMNSEDRCAFLRGTGVALA